MKFFGLCFCLASCIWSSHANDALVEPTSKDNSGECQCYLVNGPDAGYFQHHRFYDFRSIANDGSNDYTVAPAIVGESDSSGGQPSTSSYLSSTDWADNWGFLDGKAGASDSSVGSGYENVYSRQNVYISRNTTEGAGDSTFLTLRAARPASSFMSSSQITSRQQNLLHASIRARMRVIPNGLGNGSAPSAGPRVVDNADAGSNASQHPVDTGAVVGLFTYQSDTQESDIEILTQDPVTSVRYSNQPDYDAAADRPVPGASSQMTLPDDMVYTEWIVHRLDWFDGVVRWWAGNTLVLNKTINAPSEPSGLVLNVWGNGGYWSGNMSIGGEVTVGIEWIELVFNVSGPIDGPSKRSEGRDHLEPRSDEICKVGCSVDGVKDVGFPEKTFDNGATGVRCGILSGHLSGYVLAVVTVVVTIVLVVA
jgi:hypothetical protein